MKKIVYTIIICLMSQLVYAAGSDDSGSDNNKATLVHKEGCDDLPLMKKSELAHKILDRTIEYID